MESRHDQVTESHLQDRPQFVIESSLLDLKKCAVPSLLLASNIRTCLVRHINVLLQRKAISAHWLKTSQENISAPSMQDVAQFCNQGEAVPGSESRGGESSPGEQSPGANSARRTCCIFETLKALS